MPLHISTLDIDTNDKLIIERIAQKIINCPYLIEIEIKPSHAKGVHFIIGCMVECCICRLCYDDIYRFAFDCKRPNWARNILFDKKEYVKKNELPDYTEQLHGDGCL